MDIGIFIQSFYGFVLISLSLIIIASLHLFLYLLTDLTCCAFHSQNIE